MNSLHKILLISSLTFLSACSSTIFESSTTSHPNNACNILNENDDWLYATHKSYKKWGIPVSIQLAFIKHESSFRYNARPLKKKGFFFDDYQSSAYGYSQALDGTWKEYKTKNNKPNADRTSFYDSSDFVGWYLNRVSKSSKIKKHDIYNLYLAYHEGVGGWKKRSYLKKRWLVKKAKVVKNSTITFSKQLRSCTL
jgi:hypothetical protein